MMKHHWRLFSTGVWLGATVFGGLNAAYPLIKARAVEEGWANAREVDGLYALALFLPGPSFLNLWGSVALRGGGLWGALLGQVGLLLPSFLIVLAVPLLGRLPWAAARADGALMGIAAATAGVLLATRLDGARQWRQRWPLLLGAVCLLLLFAGVNPLLLLALVGAAGALRARLRAPRGV